MASIEKRGERWRVRWRDPDGTARSKSCGSLASARELRREVEDHESRGRIWRPETPQRVPQLADLADAWLRDLRRLGRAPGTISRAYWALTGFTRWLEAERIEPDARALRYRTIEQYDIHLEQLGRTTWTRRASGWAIRGMWTHACRHPEWRGLVEAVEAPTMPSVTPRFVVAPTWADLDAVVEAAQERPGRSRHQDWLWRTAVLLRATGWRVGQILGLTFGDVDLELGLITCRTGKSRQERRGRVVPAPTWLLPIIREWSQGRAPDDLIQGLPSATRHRVSDRLTRCWRDTGAAPELYQNRPAHAFRVGLVSELAAARAPTEAVELYVGHAVAGVRRHYLDTSRVDLVEVASKIPPIGSCVRSVSTSAGPELRSQAPVRL